MRTRRGASSNVRLRPRRNSIGERCSVKKFASAHRVSRCITRLFPCRFGFLMMLAGLMVLAGCAHQPREMARPQPLPNESHTPEEEQPETVKNVPELLREADAELRKAKDAHERGDFDTAFRHYQRMLQLILEADLDPSLFYESSDQFEEILRFYLKHAHLYHHPERRLGSSHTGKYSDITIPFPLPQPVLDEIAELQNSYSNTFQRGLNRSSRYLPHIKEEFREAGLPEDLAWLAMVESMFQPRVVSPAGAGGMWQFMRATGRRFHLRQDSYVDERYNWHSATRAAAEYLQCLHNFFNGDWALAITAYNMGEGGMDRAISANGGDRDFWTLINTPPASERIKQESKKFYPRLLAYIIVANAPEQYGFTYAPEPFEDVLRIPVQGGYQLADLDTAMGFSRGTLASLNPDLLQEVTPGHGEYAVAVPREKREEFLAALQTTRTVRTQQVAAASSTGSGGSGGRTHRVRRGETILQIANRYGCCDKELMRVNKIRTARALQANQVLQIPDSGQGRGGGQTASLASASVDNAASARTTTAAEAQPRQSSGPEATYTVKAGDTLSKIAQSHKVAVADLQKLNKIPSNGHIQVGQVLKLGVPAQTAPTGPRYHEVKPGEYPSVIASLYGLSTRDLLALNSLTPQSVIRPGDRLVVSGTVAVAESGGGNTTAKTAQEPARPASIQHKVAAGETAGAIAGRYGVKISDLLAWNNLTPKSILRVGQTLTINNASRTVAQRDRSSDIQVSQAQAQKVVHKVTAGQNPTTIARHYGVNVNDLFKWNNWSDKHVLRVGDEVSIYKD